MSTLQLRIVIAGFISVLFTLLIGVVISAQTMTIMQLIVKIAFCAIFCVPLALSSYFIADTLTRIADYKRIRRIVSDMSDGDCILELRSPRGESLRIVCYEDADLIEMISSDITRSGHDGEPDLFCREHWYFDLHEREVVIDLEFDDKKIPPDQVNRSSRVMLDRIAHDTKSGRFRPLQ